MVIGRWLMTAFGGVMAGGWFIKGERFERFVGYSPGCMSDQLQLKLKNTFCESTG